MPFSRVYLEITNCCNLACSFCPGTTRRAAFLTVAQFTHLAGALRGQMHVWPLCPLDRHNRAAGHRPSQGR